MSTAELLNIQPEKFVQYQITTDESDYGTVMNSPIHPYGVMLVGQEGKSSRGFEVAYEEESKSYNVRIFTPSTTSDWLSAYRLIEGLAKYLQVYVEDEEENVYVPDQITYDYNRDIAFGIQSFKGKENYFIFGINRLVGFDMNTIEAILSAEDAVQFFNEFMEEQQYVDAYIANPQFYQKKNDNKIMGMFTITKTVPTILPSVEKPFIDITKYNIKNKSMNGASVWLTLMVMIMTLIVIKN